MAKIAQFQGGPTEVGKTNATVRVKLRHCTLLKVRQRQRRRGCFRMPVVAS